MCLHGVLVRGIRQKQQNTGEGSVDPRLCLRRKSLQAFDYGVQTQQHNSHDAHNDTGGQPVPDHRHAHANAQHHVQKDPPPRPHQCDTLGQHTPFRQQSHTNAQGKQDTTNRVYAQCDKVFLFHNRIPLKTIFSKAVSLLSMHILSGARIHGRRLFRFLQEGVSPPSYSHSQRCPPPFDTHCNLFAHATGFMEPSFFRKTSTSFSSPFL